MSLSPSDHQGSEQSRRYGRDALPPAVQSRDGNVSASICGAPPDRAGEISAWLHAGAHRADCPWLWIFAPGAFVRHVQASCRGDTGALSATQARGGHEMRRSEEHTSELQSLMRISYAVFCLEKKKSTHIKS